MKTFAKITQGQPCAACGRVVPLRKVGERSYVVRGGRVAELHAVGLCADCYPLHAREYRNG